MTCALGITGGIACGKSEVGRLFEKRGWAVLDTDHVAHQVMEPGGKAYAGVVEAFGPEILDAEGRIDRKCLGALVFADEARRLQLNRLVHPAVRAFREDWIVEKARLDQPVAVLIPLLFEVDATEGWTAIICIRANPEIVRKRMRARGLDDTEIEQRIAAQMPVDEKAARSDFVIENNGSLEDLEREVFRVIEALPSPMENEDE